MRLNNLYIGDFGIFNNQHIKKIGKGLVVIGGYNRSGKTTLLKLLRYLGYGFPRDGSLPPPTKDYYVEADIETDPKEKYNLSIKGYAKPAINIVQGKEDTDITVHDLYNNLDQFTYHQVYTISLDELQKIPEGVSGSRDKERLQSVLLGAGLSQIVELPAIARSYFNKAHSIGAKYGKPDVSEFKPYNERIEEAEKEKKEALKQVEEYIEKEEEIKNISEIIEKNEKSISSLKKKNTRLDVLKNNYDNYTELKELEINLSDHKGEKIEKDKFPEEKRENARSLIEQYEEIDREYQETKEDFRKNVSQSNINTIKEKLLEQRGRLEKHSSQLAGYQEKIKNYREQKKTHEEKYGQLQAEAENINSDWEDNLQKAMEIKTDQIEQHRLTSSIEKLKELKHDLKEEENKLRQFEEEYDNKKTQLEQAEKGRPNKVFKKTFLIGLLSLFTGISVSVINIIIGMFIGFSFLVLTIIYYFSRYNEERDKLKKFNEEKRKINEIKTGIENRKKEIDILKDETNKTDKILDKYRNILGTGKQKMPEMIKDYFISLQDLKKRYKEWEQEKEKLISLKKNIKEELSSIYDLINTLEKYFTKERFLLPENQQIIQKSDQIFSALKTAFEFLEYAIKLNNIENKKEELEAEIEVFLADMNYKGKINEKLQKFEKQLKLVTEYEELEQKYNSSKKHILFTLRSSDRIKQDLLDYGQRFMEGTEDLMDIFDQLYNKYTSVENVEEDYSKTSAELRQLEQELEEKKDSLKSLKEEKEKLASPEKIEKAHKKLNKARNELRSLAERYALNRTVSFVLNKVRERAINRAKEDLLEPAGQVMEKLTKGEYIKIEPPSDLKEPDFKTTQAEGNKQESIDYLSRGTKEQLFLAVRISRIKEIKPPLPVILDDSLVNYDRSHLFQAAEILSELAESHQIFVLTCHPHLVDFINNGCFKAQFWKLRKGEISETRGEELVKYLSC